ncbi:hypothetical protein [Sulfuricurvum sp.]|uniref:hypothetical protein n=1 Tax=Sulfuricurvum sp. TaxID=2025608 RepID=UPI002E352545|nr:hypothetical protein [Sulfuricurvum sp.]HEX5330626.1 hypothetical protein [Sulfuricurvum sp.]
MDNNHNTRIIILNSDGKYCEVSANDSVSDIADACYNAESDYEDTAGTTMIELGDGNKAFVESSEDDPKYKEIVDLLEEAIIYCEEVLSGNDYGEDDELNLVD